MIVNDETYANEENIGTKTIINGQLLTSLIRAQWPAIILWQNLKK